MDENKTYPEFVKDEVDRIIYDVLQYHELTMTQLRNRVMIELLKKYSSDNESFAKKVHRLEDEGIILKAERHTIISVLTLKEKK